MGLWSLRQDVLSLGTLVYQPPTGAGVVATADAATAHTPGAWVEIVASLASDVDLVVGTVMAVIGAGGINTSTLIDVAKGAIGSEVVIASGLAVGYWANTGVGYLLLPLALPAGARLAFRAQSAVLSKTANFRWTAYKTGRLAPRSLIACGVNTATSRGVDPVGTTVNVEGAWSTLIDPVPEPLSALVVTLSGAGGTAYQNGYTLIDVGIGAAGSEAVIINDIGGAMTTSEALTQPWCGPYPVDVPAGSRLAVRMKRDNTSNALSVTAQGVRRMV